MEEAIAMRDFRQEIASDTCWNPSTEKLWLEHGIPAQDIVLQNREELLVLLEWMEKQKIRSFLEIGSWTGRLVSLLHRLFDFEKVAACDLGVAQQIGLPLSIDPRVTFFQGSSHGDEYKEWRESLGHFDLVLIDGDHSYEGVKKDFEINKAFPHRFLGFHDIVNPHPQIQGVKQLWNELEGHKLEIVRPHLELGIDHSTMGIGVWSATAEV